VALEVDTIIILEMGEMTAARQSAGTAGWVMEGVGKGGETRPGRWW